MKVSDYLKDAHDPRGDLGSSVEHDVAWAMAAAMRTLMNQDKWEEAIGLEVYAYNGACDQEELIAAWGFLNAGERRAWKEFCCIGKAHADQ